MSAVYICECTHPKSQHKRERFGCRAPDCGCGQFEADMAASAAAQGVEQPSGLAVQGGAWLGDELGLTPDALSTSARLAKAEQERNEFSDLVDKIAAELTGVLKERDSLARRCAVRFEEAEKLRAELVSARQEVEQLRAALTKAGEERDELVAEAIDAAEEKVRVALAADSPYPEPGCGKHTGNASNRCLLALGHTGRCDDDPPVATVHADAGLIFRAAAGHCAPCGWTSQNDPHPHPLAPVWVSITHRTEGPTE